jgi:hypothetical protein
MVFPILPQFFKNAMFIFGAGGKISACQKRAALRRDRVVLMAKGGKKRA